MFLPRRLNISNILLLVRTRKPVEWYWCGSCGHCFCPVFNKRKESSLDLRVAQTKTTTYTWESHGRLDAEWTEHYKILFVRIDGPKLHVIPKTVTPTITKEILTCQKQSPTDSVYPLATLFSHMEMILKTWISQSLSLSQLEFLCRTRDYCSADRW